MSCDNNAVLQPALRGGCPQINICIRNSLVAPPDDYKQRRPMSGTASLVSNHIRHVGTFSNPSDSARVRRHIRRDSDGVRRRVNAW